MTITPNKISMDNNEQNGKEVNRQAIRQKVIEIIQLDQINNTQHGIICCNERVLKWMDARENTVKKKN
jgi:hypothetical protein